MSAPRLAALLSFALGAGALLAQESGGPAVPAAPVEANPPLRADPAPVGSLQPVPAAVRMRDPFRGSARLEGTAVGYTGGSEAAPTGPHRPVIDVQLLGLLRVKGRPPAALLHCDQYYCVVRAGDRFTAGKQVRAAVEVLEVNQAAVRLLVDGEEREVR